MQFSLERHGRRQRIAKAAPYLFHVVIFHHFSIFDFQRLYSSSFPKRKEKGIKQIPLGLSYQFKYGFPCTKGSNTYVKPSELLRMINFH